MDQETVDPDDPEYREFAKFWNAVSGMLIDFCVAIGAERPSFSMRGRFADQTWHELHPESKYGAPGRFGPT